MIQDSQFSPLGVVLVAQLANAQALIGLARGYEKKDSLTALPVNVQESSPHSEAEDLGVAIRRTSPQPLDLIDLGSTSALALGELPITGSALEEGKQVELDFRGGRQRRLPAESNRTCLSEETAIELQVQPKSTRRKRSKRTNAIDDLFQGLR